MNYRAVNGYPKSGDTSDTRDHMNKRGFYTFFVVSALYIRLELPALSTQISFIRGKISSIFRMNSEIRFASV